MRWLVRARAPDWLQLSSREKDAPSAISTGVKNLWKANSVYRSIVFQNFGVFPHRSFSRAPDCPVRCFELLGPRTAALKTARDCRRLKRRGQAKSARRTCRAFTSRAQFFHKGKILASNPRFSDLKGNLPEILPSAGKFPRNCTTTT